MGTRLEAFLAMLERGQDSALLRYSIGREYMAQDRAADAVPQLREALRQDEDYSAAWKELGKALAACGDAEGAAQAYRSGIERAEAQGDRQAAKEMRVFLRRLERAGARPED